MNVWAMTTAASVNVTRRPHSANGAPIQPRRPKTSKSDNPATAGGKTIGKSMRLSTSVRPEKFRRAIR